MKTTLNVFGAAAIALASAPAAVINVANHTVTPDGSTTTSEQLTDVATPNSGNVLPSGGTSLAYAITTFNFGVGSDVHMVSHFVASLGSQQDRVGIRVDDAGFIDMFGIGPQQANSTFDLSQDMAGQSLTVLMKFDYDVNRNLSSADDTLFEAWINPDGTATEGASDIQSVWNSASFPGFIQRIDNQSTPGTAGDSSITNTVIFTGSDATFANALTAIPEPSIALLSGLGVLGLLRRRR